MENSVLEEIFCLKYELNSLSEITLKNESERMLPGFCSDLIENDHRERYNLVCNYSVDRTVLDFACGVGYGSKIIAERGNAKKVLGCDLSKDAIRYAKHRFSVENLDFEVQDAEAYLKESHYDLIVSFETIEHLPNPHKFLENVFYNLKQGGIFIVSTPISKLDVDTNPSNPYHLIEWGFKAFQNEVSKKFQIDKIYTQLYQNEFLNDLIRKQFNERKLSFLQKRVDKLKAKIRGTAVGPILFDNWYGKSNFSKMEEYTGQYNLNDFGWKYLGYQILICTKK